MFFNSATNDSNRRENSLPVEWHDCSWQPAIHSQRRLAERSISAIKPLPAPALLPHPVGPLSADLP